MSHLYNTALPCLLQLDKMDASARQKAEMAQKIAQELLKSSSHRLASAPLSMPALNTEQSSLVRAAQQKAAEIAVQVLTAFPLHFLAPVFVSWTLCFGCVMSVPPLVFPDTR